MPELYDFWKIAVKGAARALAVFQKSWINAIWAWRLVCFQLLELT